MPIRPGMAAAGVAILASCLVQPSVLAAPPTYRLTVIPRLDYHQAIPTHINNAGHVIGWLVKDDQPLHAFLYRDGTTIDLQSADGGIFDEAAMNEQGIVVGSIGDRAYMYRDGEFIALETPGYDLLRATDINDGGQIIGSAVPAGGGPLQAFLYDDGVASILPLGAFISMHPAAISNAGTVVGAGNLTDARNPERHPFVYREGQLVDAGSLGRHSAYAIEASESGRVVGILDKDPDHRNTHAFVLSSSGKLRDLGTLGGTNSYPYDINTSGRIVGSAALATGYFRAFLYGNGVMHDLGALGGEMSVAYGITDNGQVVGNAHYENRTSTIFIHGVDGPRTLDLNDLIDPADPLKPFVRLEQTSPRTAINEFGQILATGTDSRRRRKLGYIVSPVDSTPPLVTASVTGVMGDRGWYTSDATVTWITTDPEAPIGARAGCATATVTLDSTGTQFDCQATSLGGASPVNSVTIKRDASSPSVEVTSPGAGAVYERNEIVPAAFQCSDAVSGIQACRGPVPAGALIDTSAPVTDATFRVVGIDRAGNRRVVVHAYTVN